MSKVRVRFAPSPTGFLHVGGARTAIFNWLFARRRSGVFVLRIEDTDAERSSPEMVRAILDALEWLEIDADEGPVFQSALRERHAADAASLLATGQAYRCFCSPAMLAAARSAAPAGGRDYVYPRTCREIPEESSRRRAGAGEPFAVRFRVPDREIAWDDEVHGRTAFVGERIEDFVLLRSDGSPTYMMSVVSDDVAMQITHVIRGDDHLSNTPKQILLYEALGRPVPIFAHLPLILGPDRKRLSKRHGAVSVLQYRDRGYLPEAMFNFLALLGWSPGGDREVLDRGELIEGFDLDGVGKAGAVFDLEKLDWLNGRYLERCTAESLAGMLEPRLRETGLWPDSQGEADRARLLGTLELLRGRARTLEDFVERGRPYLLATDELSYDAQTAAKHLEHPEVAGLLEQLVERLGAVERWSAPELESALRALASERGIAAGKLIHPARLALTGQGVSPGIFEVLELLGRERSLRRLQRLVERIRAGAVV
jgi:glutamyl-tRNA synthetase